MIGITGATGEIGNKVLKILNEKHVSICTFIRDTSKCADHFWNNIEKRKFDITHQPTNVFDGITSLLWISPINHQNLILNEAEWMQFAKSAGVKHIVKLSVMLTEQQDIFNHRDSELILERSGMFYTHLRPNTFMQNYINYEMEAVTKTHRLRYPAGEGKTSFIDTRDIAQVAAEILLNPENHRNKGYTLTGPKAHNYYEVAEFFSDRLGVKINYIDTYQHPEFETEENTKKTIRQNFFKAVRAGLFSQVSPDVELILGRKPISLHQYITDYRDLFLEKISHQSGVANLNENFV